MKFDFKRLMSRTLLTLFFSNQLQAIRLKDIWGVDNMQEIPSILKNNQAATVFGITTVGLSLTNIYSYYKKRQAQKELALMCSEVVQKAKDEDYVSELIKYIEGVYLNFEAEIQLAKSKPNLYHEEYIERLVYLAKQKKSLFALSDSTLSSLITYQNELELKIAAWNKKSIHYPYMFKAQEILKELNSLHIYFKELNSSLKSQANFIDISLLLDKNSFSKYNRELTLSKQFIGQQYFIELDKVIRASVNADNIFPYLTYSSKLQRDIDVLQNTLDKIKGTKLFVFQERVIKQATELVSALRILLENVVSIKSYQEEQVRKPEFEKQQKLLEQELKEREQHLKNEKTILETKLGEEKNKEQKLLNEHAAIERDRQALFLQHQNSLLEMEKIRNGQALKEELEKNNKNWKSEIDRLIKDHQKSIENNNKEVQEKIQKSEQELKNLKQKLGEIEYKKGLLENELGFTKGAITGLKNYLNTIESQLANPPFNPDTVDGLRAYLNNIRNNALAALKY